MKLGENTHMEIESIPTGSLGLDMALGVGGIPKGRIVEVYGVESGGKNNTDLTYDCRSPENGWAVCIY